MRLVGIPLDVSNNQGGKWLRYWSIGFGFASISFNFTINLLALVFQTQPKTTSHWNQLIADVNATFSFTMAHLGLFLFTAPKWKELFLALQRIEKLNLFELDDYKKFRQLLINAGFFYLFMVRSNDFFKIDTLQSLYSAIEFLFRLF